MRKISLFLAALLFIGFSKAATFTVNVAGNGAGAGTFSDAYTQAVASADASNVIEIDVASVGTNLTLAGGSSPTDIAESDLIIRSSNGATVTLDFGWTGIGVSGNSVRMESVGFNVGWQPITLSGTDFYMENALLTSQQNVLINGTNAQIINSPINVQQLFINATDAFIQGGDMTFGATDGTVANAATNATIRDLTINTNGGNFLVYGSNSNFVNVTVNHPGLDASNEPGVWFREGSSGHLIDSCTFLNNFWLGKVVPPLAPDNCTISNSTFNYDFNVIGDGHELRNCYVNRALILGNTSGWPNLEASGLEVVECTVGPNNAASEGRILLLGSDNRIDSCTLFGKCINAFGERNSITGNLVNVVNNPNSNDNSTWTAGWFNTQAGIQIQTDVVGSTSGISTGYNVVKNNVLRTSITITQTININGVRVTRGSVGDTITGNDVTGFWNGIMVQSSGTAPSGTYVDHNYTYACHIDGVRTVTANNVSIMHNISYGNGIDPVATTFEEGFGVRVQENSTGNIVFGNIVWDNKEAGIGVHNASGATIDSNLTGLDTLGIAGNAQQYGVQLKSGAFQNTVGTNYLNVIAGNTADGIIIDGSNQNTIENNVLGNSLNINPTYENGGYGIRLENGASLNEIGSETAGNIIAYRTGTDGAISVSGATTTGNEIIGNSTFCNAGQGIDLNTGGNEEYAAGILAINRAAQDATTMDVDVPNDAQWMDVYAADTSCHSLCDADAASLNEEPLSQGQTFVQRINIAAISPAGTVTITSAMAGGMDLTAAIVTVTDANGNTSEFSTCKFEALCQVPENPTVTAPNNGAFCAGDDITLSASSSSSGVDYMWFVDGVFISGPDATDQITVTSGGNYTVRILDPADTAICQVDADITITRNNNPTVADITGEDSVCIDDATEQVYMTSTTGLSYLWSVGSDATIASGQGTNSVNIHTFTGQPATTITLSATDATTGCDTTITYQVVVNDLPVVDGISGDTEVQCSESGVSYSILNPVSGYSYSWTVPSDAVIVGSNGADSTSIIVDFGTVQGSITASATNGLSGCQSETVFELPVSLLGCGLSADFTVEGIGCIGNEITFTDNSQYDTDVIVDWQWTFGDGANPSTANGEGPHVITYSTVGVKEVMLIVTDASGGIDTAINSNAITINNNPGAPSITELTPVCEGEEADYNVIDGASSSIFDWSLSDASSSITQGNGTDTISVLFGPNDVTISVVETDSNGCMSPEGITFVEVDPLLTGDVEIQGVTEACDNLSPDGGTYTFTATGVQNANSYTWSIVSPDSATLADSNTAYVGGQGTDTYVYNFGSYSGTVQLQVIAQSNPNCNSIVSEDLHLVDVYQSVPVTYALTNDKVCDGATEVYTAVLVGDPQPNNSATFYWEENGSPTDTTILNMYTYLEIEDGDELSVEVVPDYCYDVNNSTLEDQIQLLVYPYPETELVLSGDEVEQTGFGIIPEYTIDGIITLPNVTMTETNSSGFDSVDYVYSWYWQVEEDSLYGGQNSYLAPDENGSITLGYSISPNYTATTLPIDSTVQSYTIPYLVVRDYYENEVGVSCPDTAWALLLIDFDIFIPNVFTPNEDGFYDTWTVENGLKYGPLSVQIFNRWGNLVYNSNAWDNAWLGINNDGEELPFGTYFYILETAVEGAPVFRGTVTILK